MYEVYSCNHVYDRSGPVGDRQLYTPPRRRNEDGEIVENKVVRKYAPLRDAALFPNFARLAEDQKMDTQGLYLRRERLEGAFALPDELDTEKNRTVALDWIRRYGVLGLTPHPRTGTWWPDPRGGEGDTLKRFVYEAWVANASLRLYEAASSEQDVSTIESIFRLSDHYRLPEGSAPRFRSPKQARRAALEEVNEQVETRLELHGFPKTYERPDGAFMRSFGFRSLLGAMWLQMWWLLTTTGEEGISRCPWCNRIITIEPPVPVENPQHTNARGKYKTRKDKTYCNDNHRAKHFYHYERKPLKEKIAWRKAIAAEQRNQT